MGKITRRAFLATGGLVGGGLALGIAFAPNRLSISGSAEEGEARLNTWVRLTPDNKITVVVPHSEMGQGSHTALPMMLADEMDASWDLVSMVQAPANETYVNSDLARGYTMGDVSLPESLFRTLDYSLFKLAAIMDVQNTGGSSAVRMTGQFGFRRAGAAARHMLLQAAARRWAVPVSTLTASNSVITHAPSGRAASYGELAAEAATFAPPVKPNLKQPGQFTIMGTNKPRFDVPDKVRGHARYGIDVEVPGMLHAAIKHAPVFDSRLASYAKGDVLARRGVKKVVELDGAVAVVADNFWRAKSALDALDLQCVGGDAGSANSGLIYERYANALKDGEGKPDLEAGDVPAALTAADKTLRAQYRVPFLAHATMEPMNCTAAVRDGKCEIWLGHQNPLAARRAAADAAGIDVDDVTVHNQYLGGGFGRRSNVDFVDQAVRIAKEAGAPVKLIWSREEDIQHDKYRPAVVAQLEAGLDASGIVTAWSNVYSNSGQNEPAEAPLTQYTIANQHIRGVEVTSAVPLASWRSVGHTQHGFFNESFVDELAHAAGQDPYAFRRALLKDMPRHRHVLEVAAREAGWRTPLPAGRARGIAIEQSFGSICAEVAEISVTPAGEVQVHKVTAAIDCGFAVSPQNVEAQIQSGIIYGLTAALYGEIEIAEGCVVQANFPDYEMVRLVDAPEIKVHIINSGEAIGGIGEPGTPPIAPALTNAIFAATGKRLRSLPVARHDLAYAAPTGAVEPAAAAM